MFIKTKKTFDKYKNTISFESSATVEPRQRISIIYIYLYVSDRSVFIGSESLGARDCSGSVVECLTRD